MKIDELKYYGSIDITNRYIELTIYSLNQLIVGKGVSTYRWWNHYPIYNKDFKNSDIALSIKRKQC